MSDLVTEEDAPADDAARPGASSREDPIDTVRLLIVEDDEDDFLITRDLLAEQDRLPVSVDWTPTYAEALAEIHRQAHDVYLVDYRLGSHTGLELMREGFASRPFAPVIMLTGQPTHDIDLEATALGATDFLSKRGLTADELERSIRYAINHQKAERYALAARAANDGIWDWDLSTDRIYLSPRWFAILGAPEEPRDVHPSVWFDLVAADDVLRLRNEIEAHLAGQTPHLETEFRMRHRDGSWRWVTARGLATRDVDGTPIRMAGSLSDSTDRHVAVERLEHEALHDTLTGLPNRTLFADRVEQTLQRAAREASAGCALLFLDLDGFKEINDTLSHAVGDELLVAFAERIAKALRPGDTVARLGGDEFTVLLEELLQPAEATVIAERILRSLRDPFTLDGNEILVGASIGISLSADGLSPADLISAADLAMYDAKRQGRGRWAVFDEHMHRRVEDRLARQNELRQVIEHSLLEVHFQPIVRLDNGRLVGLEALARWPSDRAPLAPEDFIAIAEEIGLIGSLGEYVMREALVALRGWRQTGAVGEDVWVSVNLSARQLSDIGLGEQVGSVVAESQLPAHLLRLEVTEGTLMAVERSQQFLSAITEAGIGLHVDDFGTGYSSVTALHRLPIRGLKIDRRLVADLALPRNRAIARSVVALAHSLDVPAIGAGIEDESQRQGLAKLRCDLGQGRQVGQVLAGHALDVALAAGARR
jgi:diguanylate cyclase (GGDEF)-like protein/PAS domain S-box-containing protein